MFSADTGLLVRMRYEMSSKPGMNRAAFIRSLAAAGGACPLVAAVSRASQDGGFRLLDHPRRKRDFADKRSYKVIFIAHCMLNMNARMHQCSNVWSSAVHPIIDFCRQRDIGMMQMPCPEFLTVGLGRDRDDPEQDHLRQALEMPVSREIIRKLAEQMVFQMKEYDYQGYRIVAIIGNDGSPSCGVDLTHDLQNKPGPGTGIFIEELRDLLKAEGLDIPFKGNLDGEEEKTLAWLEETCRDMER